MWFRTAKQTTPAAPPTPLWRVLEDEFVALGGTLPADWEERKQASLESQPTKQDPSARENEAYLPLIYALIHEGVEEGTGRAALCFSGGGIRSATFNLGILQRLAEVGLLEKFDYLSTVSGGGYLGSWLSGWTHRHPDGLAGVARALRWCPSILPRQCTGGEDGKSGNGCPELSQTVCGNPITVHDEIHVSPVNPEPPPLRHLRAYSRFLSPKLGALSADTWTLATIYFRNLMLNWLVLVPLLLAVLTIPRFATAFVAMDPGRLYHGLLGSSPLALALAQYGLLVLGLFCTVWSFVYAGLHQPSNRPLLDGNGTEESTATARRGSEGELHFLRWCLTPLLLGAVCLTTYWVWDATVTEHDWELLIGFGITLAVIGWAVSAVYDGRIGRLRELPWAVIAGIGAGLALWASAYLLDSAAPKPQEGLGAGLFDAYYVTLAFPLTLLSLSVGATLYLGLISRLLCARRRPGMVGTVRRLGAAGGRRLAGPGRAGAVRAGGPAVGRDAVQGTGCFNGRRRGHGDAAARPQRQYDGDADAGDVAGPVDAAAPLGPRGCRAAVRVRSDRRRFVRDLGATRRVPPDYPTVHAGRPLPASRQHFPAVDLHVVRNADRVGGGHVAGSGSQQVLAARHVPRPTDPSIPGRQPHRRPAAGPVHGL